MPQREWRQAPDGSSLDCRAVHAMSCITSASMLGAWSIHLVHVFVRKRLAFGVVMTGGGELLLVLPRALEAAVKMGLPRWHLSYALASTSSSRLRSPDRSPASMFESLRSCHSLAWIPG